MRIHIKTYGCTLNQADGDIMRSVLEGGGNCVSEDAGGADVVVVNTCTVKRQTSQRILDRLKLLQSQGRRIVVSGCMAGANRDLIERYVPSASIVTISNVHMLNEVVEAAASGRRMVIDGMAKRDRLGLLGPMGGVIARIPVSDGCLSSCSFCETKHARGPLNSFSKELIIKAVERAARMGAREVQLTSQDIGAYGIDRGTNIAELMQEISRIGGDFKVRIGMLNPEHLHRYFDEFAEALDCDRFYKFAHLPVQSGSDAVLRHMRRAYTVESFEDQARELRRRVPGIAIETDVIVGYPTETQEDFALSKGMIGRVAPEVTNISRFGARPHASASRVKQLDDSVINSRSAEMAREVRAVQHKLNDRFIGKDINVIVTESNGKSLNGRSASYRQVVMLKEDACQEARVGSECTVRVYAASANALYGRCGG